MVPDLKEVWAPRLGTAALLAATARAAGLAAVDAVEYAADLGLDRAADLVDYRYSQVHCREWISGLPGPRRAELRAAAIATIEPMMEPYRPRVVQLSRRPRDGVHQVGRRPGHPSVLSGRSHCSSAAQATCRPARQVPKDRFHDVDRRPDSRTV